MKTVRRLRPLRVIAPGRSKLACAFLLALLIPILCVSASEGERPCSIWLGGSAGVEYDRNEQYSPLTHSGLVLGFEGGWIVRGRYLIWNGDITWSSGSVSSRKNDDFTVDTTMLAGETGLCAVLPISFADTTVAAGLSVSALWVSTDVEYEYNADVCNNAFLGVGPSILLENGTLDRWTFRLYLALPLIAWSWSPDWVNGAGEDADTEWQSIPDYLLVKARVSAGLRVSERLEALIFYSFAAERHETPLSSRRIRNQAGFGLEFDLGSAR